MFLVFFSLQLDENNNFTWNWDDNVVYDLTYSDRRKKNLTNHILTYVLLVFQQVMIEF